jgi:hypothetical protein
VRVSDSCNQQVEGASLHDVSRSNFDGSRPHVPGSAAQATETEAANQDPVLQAQKEVEDRQAFMKDPRIIQAMQNIVNAEGALDTAQEKHDAHAETYDEQLDEYKQLNPDKASDDLEDAFGSKYVERGHITAQHLTNAENALKQVRADSRKFGLPCVHSTDQVPGFFSVVGEGPNEETGKLVAQTCKRKRIEDWMKDSEKTSKLQSVE